MEGAINEADTWTCFEFDLPYFLYELAGPVEFKHGDLKCRLNLARRKRAPDSRAVSYLDDPFGRTDFSGVQLCIQGLIGLDLEHISQNDEERKALETRFGRDAPREYIRTLHKFLIDAVNAVVDAYSYAWGAWRYPPINS